jgi:hypothetical protein
LDTEAGRREQDNWGLAVEDDKRSPK